MDSNTTGSVETNDDNTLLGQCSSSQKMSGLNQFEVVKIEPNYPEPNYLPLEIFIKEEAELPEQNDEPMILVSASGERRTSMKIESDDLGTWENEPKKFDSRKTGSTEPRNSDDKIQNGNRRMFETNFGNAKMSSEKKKRKAFDISVKLGALEEIRNGISKKVIAENLGTSVSTIHEWTRNEESLKKWAQQHNDLTPRNLKRMRKPDQELVDQATWTWFEERRRQRSPVSGPMLKAQALHFWQQLGGKENFEASEGWLSRWKLRHGIRSITISEEKSSASHEAAENYKQEFLNIVETEGLTPEQIFNCDETGLNFRQMPNRTLSVKSEINNSESKAHKERLTVMACSNASGNIKLPLVVIGKYAKPRAIKDLSRLPASYKSQRNAWMSISMFEEWFYQEFVPYVKESLVNKGFLPKAVLFVDNCSAHGKENLVSGGIKVVFFPFNTTSIIQPMDQGCLQNLKLVYRQKLMAFILEKLNEAGSVAQALKSVTIRDVIFWIANAWKAVAISTIVKSWKPLWPHFVQTQLPQVLAILPCTLNVLLVDEFLAALQKEGEFRSISRSDVINWVDCNNSMTMEESLTDEEIIEMVKDTYNEKENVTNAVQLEESCGGKKSEMTLEEARLSIGRIIKLCEGRALYSPSDLQALTRIRDIMEFDPLLSRASS